MTSVLRLLGAALEVKNNPELHAMWGDLMGATSEAFHGVWNTILEKFPKLQSAAVAAMGDLGEQRLSVARFVIDGTQLTAFADEKYGNVQSTTRSII